MWLNSIHKGWKVQESWWDHLHLGLLYFSKCLSNSAAGKAYPSFHCQRRLLLLPNLCKPKAHCKDECKNVRPWRVWKTEGREKQMSCPFLCRAQSQKQFCSWHHLFSFNITVMVLDYLLAQWPLDPPTILQKSLLRSWRKGTTFTL